MIVDSQFFILGLDQSTPNLHMYKITFGNTNADWANSITCSSGTWTLSQSESLLSTDKSKIYSFFTYGSNLYLYFVTLLVSDGSVIGSRFKSSITCSNVFGSALNENYIFAAVECSSYYLLSFSISSLTFTMNTFSGYLTGLGVEPLSGRYKL